MKKKKVYDPNEVPENMTDEEAHNFWSTHEATEEYLEKTMVYEDEDDDLPPVKSKPISIRIESDMIDRLQQLAKLKNKGYQTLIKQFLTERLYEEEKRTGVLPDMDDTKGKSRV